MNLRTLKVARPTKRLFGWGLACLVACGSFGATAASPQWQSVGPAPPAIPAPIAAHAPSQTIYIGSLGGGVLKSTNGGTTFFALNDNSLTSYITSMVMDPNDPNVVYAGFSKTTDGGKTWRFMNGGGGFSMAMDPTNPNIVYSGGFGVEKTIDGGETWEFLSEGLGGASIFSLAINPFNPNVVFAGTTGTGAYRSTDGAAHWSALKIDSTVFGFLVDPDNGNVVYAGTNGKGVYKSIDGGKSFAFVGSPHVRVVFSIVKSGNTLYAGTAGGGVSESQDGGVTWQNTGVTESQGLMLSVDSAGGVYVGTSFDGAFALRSDNKWHRLGWHQLKQCACQSGHAVAVDPSDHNHVFFTTNDGGLLVTQNGGVTWQDGGIHGFAARASRSVAFDPQTPRRVYASSIAGGVFKSEDGGKTWKRRRFGSSTNYTTGIAVDPVNHSVYVATLENLNIATNGIWKSTDFGETFFRVDRAPNAAPGEFLNLSGRGITVDPQHHNTVYFADRERGIWRSLNGGASWRNVDATGVFSVTVDPTDSNIVYAGTTEVGVLKSIDGGATFTLQSTGLPEGPTARTGAVLVNPKDPTVLFVAISGSGVFKSTNSAQSWFPINKGLTDLGVFGLAMDSAFPNILYGATGSSVYKRLPSAH